METGGEELGAGAGAFAEDDAGAGDVLGQLGLEVGVDGAFEGGLDDGADEGESQRESEGRSMRRGLKDEGSA